jgi:hypothetical protein
MDRAHVLIKRFLQLPLVAGFFWTVMSGNRAKELAGTRRTATFHWNIGQPFRYAKCRFFHTGGTQKLEIKRALTL